MGEPVAGGGPGQLLLGWGVYWVGLIGAKLSPAIAATWRATHLPDGHGNISAGFDNSTLTYTVIEDGVKTWVGSTSMTTALLWVAGPPLLLWLIWLFARERPSARSLDERPARVNALGEGPATEWRPRRDEGVRVDPGRVRTPNP